LTNTFPTTLFSQDTTRSIFFKKYPSLGFLKSERITTTLANTNIRIFQTDFKNPSVFGF
jgi:hypothetical protein